VNLMSIANSIRAQIPPIHREGYPFIAALPWRAWSCSDLDAARLDRHLLTVWCALFFRDPVRVTPVPRASWWRRPTGGYDGDAGVAAGRAWLGDTPLPRISIFMSVFNCHVNRSPVGADRRHRVPAGTFINAELDKGARTTSAIRL